MGWLSLNPESDGEFFALLSTLSPVLKSKGLAPGVLHVRMCCLRLRSLRGFSLDSQGMSPASPRPLLESMGIARPE